MTPNLKITLIQPNIIWQNTSANINLINKLLASIRDTELIILPEMWNTGFSMTPEPLATTMDGIVVQQMQIWASQRSSIVGGSVIIEENGRYYNRFLLVDSSGPIVIYDKKHLFTLAGEHETFQAGDKIVTYNLKGWDIRLNICYDLRFPVWSRNTSNFSALIYVANWPSSRHHAWRTLLQARAIENQCYVIGCNRVGTDPNGYTYLGGSTIIDYQGKHILEMNEKEGVASAEINKPNLLAFQSKLNFLSDRDDFSIV